MEILMFPLQIHVTFDPAGSYAVEGLKPDTLYKFSLAARSEMGLGVFTQPIEAKTAQSSKCLLFFFIMSANLNLSLWTNLRTSPFSSYCLPSSPLILLHP